LQKLLCIGLHSTTLAMTTTATTTTEIHRSEMQQVGHTCDYCR
jgi:hypothetical protein